MARINTEPIDIQNYKCVPLDLLRNVSKGDQLQFEVGPDSVSLKKFKTDLDESVRASGPNVKTVSAETIENFLIGTIITFSVLAFVLLFYYMGQNVYRYGFSGILLFSDQVKTLPVIGLASFTFLIIGFFLGFFIR